MSMEKFQNQLKKGVSLVDFNAPWCAPCRAQEPVIQKIKVAYTNRAAVIEINIDEHQDLATAYRVQSIPTLVIFKDGKEFRRFVGLQSESNLTRGLEEAF